MNRAVQSAVITGAASGIGRAIATLLAERGARLVLADIDEPGLIRVAADLDADMAVVTDVASASAMDDLATATGAVDLVCLNAGIVNTAEAGVWESPPDEWRRVFDVNVGGVVNGLRSFVPQMLEGGQTGHLLITGSLAGLLTWPVRGPYGASKHAVVAVAEQAALSLRDTQLSVTLLCPSLVKTGMSAEGEDPLVVAHQALDGVAAGEFVVVPEEWKPAVLRRATRLVAGHQPSVPDSTESVRDI